MGPETEGLAESLYMEKLNSPSDPFTPGARECASPLPAEMAEVSAPGKWTRRLCGWRHLRCSRGGRPGGAGHPGPCPRPPGGLNPGWRRRAWREGPGLARCPSTGPQGRGSHPPPRPRPRPCSPCLRHLCVAATFPFFFFFYFLFAIIIDSREVAKMAQRGSPRPSSGFPSRSYLT